MNAALNTMLAIAGFISTTGLALTYVYKAFRQIQAPQRIQDDKIKLHEEWLKKHDKVSQTDAEAEQAIKQRMERSQKILDLREKYYKRYSQFLTPKQIERVYELERKTMQRLSKKGHRAQRGRGRHGKPSRDR